MREAHWLRLGITLPWLVAALPAVGQGVSLRLVDDRRTLIDSPMRVCFYRGLETACVDQSPYVAPAQLQDFDSVTAEGPRHGPIHLVRADLGPNRGGEITISVARKALVVVEGGTESLVLSLYRRDDDTFRKAAFRYEHLPRSGTWIPAGPFVASLSDGSHAPQIEFLRADPGRKYVFRFRTKPGWSILVRCVARSTGKPTAAALAELFSASSPETQRLLGHGKTERDGLVALAGIDEPYATLSVTADGLIKSVTRGLTAASATFGFREVPLERGGNVNATVTLDGEPAAGALCQLISTRAKMLSEQASREERVLRGLDVYFEAHVRSQGMCTSGMVEAGQYLLRVIPHGATNSTDEPVTIVDEHTVELDVRLRPFEVRGTVRRGERPFGGALVLVANIDDLVSSPTGRSVLPAPLRITTDSEGRYRGFVWRRGDYSFSVTDDSWVAKASKRPVHVGEEGAAVDFQLSEAEISGVVVDQAGNPVAKAIVTLTIYKGDQWVLRPIFSLDDGQFAFSFSEGGSFRLEARKKGYRDAEPVDLNIPPDASSVSPSTLVLTRLHSLDGHVLSASGAPLPGAGVAAYQARPGVAPILVGDSLTDSDGGFSVPVAAGASTRIFVTGPGCPLQLLDVVNDETDKTIRCASISSGIEITVTNANHRPVQDEFLFLRWNGNLIPRDLLMSHLTFLGLPFKTDGAGRVTIVGLPPGTYDVFLGSGASEATIAEGAKYGYVSTAHLDPLKVVELEVQVAN